MAVTNFYNQQVLSVKSRPGDSLMKWKVLLDEQRNPLYV